MKENVAHAVCSQGFDTRACFPEMAKKYPPWLEQHDASLSAEERARYRKQMEVCKILRSLQLFAVMLSSVEVVKYILINILIIASGQNPPATTARARAFAKIGCLACPTCTPENCSDKNCYRVVFDRERSSFELVRVFCRLSKTS